ncbi:MAG: superoxide dismutase [Candidatus Liptonbacteria bacterium]|nr:superoxide dismutase [Candidatus Liptonbacteria bacterium]
MRKPFIANTLKITADKPGFSLNMLQAHFKLYEGYVKKTNEIQDKVEQEDKSAANQTYSAYGELRRQETFAVNGMKLHEVYFGHLNGNGEPKGELVKMIEKDFVSLDAWKAHMVATGICARGWAILAFDYRDNLLHVYGSDAHNVGAVWGAVPIIVLDVYEHAYAMDYGIDRKSYLDAFFKNLDWDYAGEIVKQYGLAKKHGAER